MGIDHVEISTLTDQGLAIYCVADDAGLLAVFGLKTTLRKEAKGVIQELQARQINVHVVSGDGTKAVEAVASDLGIPATQVASKQTPEGKQAYIRRLQETGKVVLFCGDGTNDAVAITEAAVGVQVESSSDVTRATADVVLLGNLKGVPLLSISPRLPSTALCSISSGLRFITSSPSSLPVELLFACASRRRTPG